MEKYKILQIAVKECGRDGALKIASPSAYGVVKNIINGVLAMEIQQSKQKEEIIKSLGNLFQVKKGSIAGAKKDDVHRIVESVFGIHEAGGEISKQGIKTFTPQELLLYYSYVERLVKTSTGTKSVISSEIKRNVEVHKSMEEKRLRAEKEKKEQEEKDKISKMSKEETIEHAIFGGNDIEYYNKLKENTDEKELIAKKLKEYWISQKKWAGNKVSKKQAVKIEAVKQILGEGDL